MNVPFYDLRAAHAELRDRLDDVHRRVMDSGCFLLGPETEAFEDEFAAYCGARHCVTVSTGLDALTLALTAAGIGPGDEVIVPSHTFIATWLSVSATGARPVPVEPGPTDVNLDPARIEAAVTARTRAILPVHLYGHPADLEPIEDIATRHGLLVIEDAAQAHGARHRGRRVGGGANTVAFSFYPGKNLGATGDGGAVVTSDAQLAERVRLLRNYGSAVKYQHDIRGGNHRLDEYRAGVLRAKLPELDAWNARRAVVAGRYLRDLDGIDGLELPAVASWADPVWHLFVVRVADRDTLRKALTADGIETGVHYPVPVHRTGAYADLGLPAGSLPRAEALSQQVLSLPMGPHLSDTQIDRVVTGVRAALMA